jgi:hypothetical protein
MATRKTSAQNAPRKTTKRARKSATSSGTRREDSGMRAAAGAFPGVSQEQIAEMARMSNMLTPEQVIELYKANTKMALDVINAAIDNTAKLRRLQFEGEETVRELGRKTAQGAAQAKDAQSLAALGQEAGREALEKSLAYWGEMFDLIVEMQKRLFALLNEQAETVPGYRHAKAAMAMMPDLGPMKNIVNAMQGMIGSGTGAFTSMQKMMGDMARMAQQSMPGTRR